MKVYISADMEGVAGIVHGEHVMRDGKEHERARRLMTQEVNAAIEGAVQAGAKTIVVNDSHGTMRNIIPEELNEMAELITGSPKPFDMMQGIDLTFDAAFFIGYHAMRGSYSGVLDHSYHGRVVHDIVLNDQRIGETGVNAAIAGYYNVPVVLVSGDNIVTNEAHQLLKNVEVATVKEGIGRFAAKCLSPPKARALIKEKATKALKNLKKFRPFKIKPPLRLELTFISTDMTQMAELVPSVKRINGRTVSFVSYDLLELYKAFHAIIILAEKNL